MLNRLIVVLLALVSALSWHFDFFIPGKELKPAADSGDIVRDPEKFRGVSSYVADHGGVPTLFVNDEPYPAAAYMTYLEEYNDYSGFADSGYKLFSVPVLFAGRWISSTELFKPFHDGIFDNKGAADFSALDASMERILSSCPDALIFPRLNISMPNWWIKENPEETDGTGKRELLYSKKFLETAAEMLRTVIDHILESDYASHIVGYQLAGGNTEEWFHFDMNAGYCKNAEDEFNSYLEEHYPDCGYSGLPDLSGLKKKGVYHKDEHLARFLEFAGNAVADDICYLAKVAKEASGYNVAVGTFYGYSLEVTSSLQGTHSLKKLLECDCVDFICSPNSYIGVRDMAYDWTEMYPADSVRLHNKLCLQECDIRTHLTRLLGDRAPEYDPGMNLAAEVWRGLDNKEQSLSQLKKVFSRQLIKGNGFWWFDMWGGWYDDDDIHASMKDFRDLYVSSLNDEDRSSIAEIAVFSDESAYKYLTDGAMRNTVFNQRKALGFMGAPYDFYDISDFEAVYKNYKAVVFLTSVKTEYRLEAASLCKKSGIGVLSVSKLKKEFTADELRALCRASGVHVYCDSDDIIYANRNYVAIHSTSEGKKTITLDGTYNVRDALTVEGFTAMSDKICMDMSDNETRLFELSPTDNH